MQIEGSVNFRDLGEGSHGRRGRLRLGRVYRSGTMHALTDGGLEAFAGLGVRVAFDLRSNSERAARPSRLSPDGSTAYHVHEHERQSGNIFQILKGLGGAGDGAALMRRVYRQLPYEFAAPYRRLFQFLRHGEGPVVFNCAAGKDRTGVAAALLLSALDVPRNLIYQDYLKTETAYDLIVEMFLSGPRGAFVSGISSSVWEPVLRTDSAYLDEMFDAIAERDGSMANYFERVLYLEARDLNALRAKLLD